MDPALVTSEFGIEPTRCWKVGDRRSTPNHTPLEGIHRETYWTAPLSADGEQSSGECSLEEFLALSLEKLKRNREFFAIVRSEGGRAELFVGLYGDHNFGIEVPPSSLAALAELGLALSLDIYPE